MPTGDVGDVGDGDDPAGTATGFDGFEFLVLLDSGDSFGFDGEEFGRTFEEEGRGVGAGWLGPVAGEENCDGWSPIVLLDVTFCRGRALSKRWPQSKAKCPIKAMERVSGRKFESGKTVTEKFVFVFRPIVRFVAAFVVR